MDDVLDTVNDREVRDALRARGMRCTPTRLQVLRALAEADEHPPRRNCSPSSTPE